MALPERASGVAAARTVDASSHVPDVWVCGGCSAECADAFAICPSCGVRRKGAAREPSLASAGAPAPESVGVAAEGGSAARFDRSSNAVALRCKLYVHDDDAGGGGGAASWRPLCVGDAALKGGRGCAPVLELTARSADDGAAKKGTVCYRHAISSGATATAIVRGPATNMLCWTAVNETGGDSSRRRYLAKFETSGYALVFEKEHQRLQHDRGRG